MSKICNFSRNETLLTFDDGSPSTGSRFAGLLDPAGANSDFNLSDASAQRAAYKNKHVNKRIKYIPPFSAHTLFDEFQHQTYKELIEHG